VSVADVPQPVVEPEEQLALVASTVEIVALKIWTLPQPSLCSDVKAQLAPPSVDFHLVACGPAP
jgi:hypothetical protein